MKIEHKNFTIREIVGWDENEPDRFERMKGYFNDDEEGVFALNKQLNIRPPYQREFVYGEKERNAVIDTIRKGFPLNVMYWAKNDDGSYGLLDGQQRTISFCEYVANTFSINGQKFQNLTNTEQQQILDYKVDIYICEGNDKERLNWFRTINIAGKKLNDQELLNANYTGEWLTDAKKKFSKTNCVAYKLGNKFVKGKPIEQDYLETTLKWISNKNIAEYMSQHQHDKNANELWLYFNNVIEWVKTTFDTDNHYRKEMLGLNWGELYNKYHDNPYDSKELEAEVKSLMENEAVSDKKGIYEYVLSGKDENVARKLSTRNFTDSDKRTVYERQNGICPKCGGHYEFKEMEGDHIVPWWRGGTTTLNNLQMLCKKCNSGKGGKAD